MGGEGWVQILDVLSTVKVGCFLDISMACHQLSTNLSACIMFTYSLYHRYGNARD